MPNITRGTVDLLVSRPSLHNGVGFGFQHGVTCQPTTPIEFVDSGGATAWTAVDSICAKHPAIRNENQHKALQPVAEMGTGHPSAPAGE